MKKRNLLVLTLVVSGLMGLAARPWPVPVSSLDGHVQGELPLRSLMVSLGQEMSRINDGLWHEDYDMIARAAREIADHPRILPDEMKTIKQALGDGFEVFVGFDVFVHDTAAALDSTAQDRDMPAVLKTQRQLQQGCISCHTAFRNDVRAVLY